jgi:adenylate cyclase
MRKKVRKIVMIGNVFIVLLTMILFFSDTLLFLDRSLYDYNLKETMTHEPDEHIIVVAIDDESLQSIQDPWPWSRDIYAPLVDSMNQPGYEAAAIAFDVLFVTESDPEVDTYFAEFLSQYNNVILPSFADTENELNRETTVKKDELMMTGKLTKPIPILDEVTHDAHINALIDSDSVIRNTWLMLDTPQGEIPSMAYKAVELSGKDVSHYLDYNAQANIAIRYNDMSYDFQTVSFIDVLTGDFPSENFKDSIVLVGFTAVGIDSQDTGTVPVENKMKLVYAHANIIDQMLNDEYIAFVPDLITFMIIILALALTMYFAWKLKTIVSIVILFAVASILLGGQYILFSTSNIYLAIIYPLTALFLSYLVNIAIKSFFDNKQKNFITKQFGRYISPDLVKEIAATDQELQLGGINKELSILFLDIRGFTTLSEKLKPEEVVDFLNMMFNLITEKALDNHGTIDKFIGDAAMIVYNAPLDVENHEYYAVKTAFDIQKGMQQVREEIKEKYDVEISVGVGVNTGNVVIGNIGSYLRMDYTAIGDNVNIAARIESNTVANQILVSETTYERTQASFEYNCIGERMMKGKTVPIKLYEVIDLIE